MRFLLFILLAVTVNAQPFSLRDPEFLGALKPNVAAAAPPTTTGLLTGLLAYWKLDEASGNLTDYSGNGRTMTRNSSYGVNFSQTGKINTALGFFSEFVATGSHYDEELGIDVIEGVNYPGGFSTSPVLPTNGSAAFSMSVWVNTTSSDSGYYTLYTTEEIGDGSGMAFAVHNGTAFFYMPGSTIVVGSGAITVADGVWHLCVLVYSPDNLSLYVDGVLDTDFGIPGSYNAGSTADGLGTYTPASGLGGTAPNHIVDEVGIWNRRLTPQNISDLATPTPFGSFTP